MALSFTPAAPDFCVLARQASAAPTKRAFVPAREAQAQPNNARAQKDQPHTEAAC